MTAHLSPYSHTVHDLSQRRLTTDLLALRESDCSRIRSKVSSDWLPSYIKATRYSKWLDTFWSDFVPLIPTEQKGKCAPELE
jgi:hypothetical protein